MHRRDLLKALPALAAAAQAGEVLAQNSQPAFKGRLRAGVVAMTFRPQLESGKITCEDTVRVIADFGLKVDYPYARINVDSGNLRKNGYKEVERCAARQRRLSRLCLNRDGTERQGQSTSAVRTRAGTLCPNVLRWVA